jgi:asparagine synthase (glutamine-hydrolysing)
MFDRPKKGFAIPLKEWMRDDLKQTFLDYLSPDLLAKYGIVNSAAIENLKSRFYDKNIDYLYNRLWLVASFHMWLEQSVFNKK